MARSAVSRYARISSNARAMARGNASVRWQPVARSQDAAQAPISIGFQAT